MMFTKVQALLLSTLIAFALTGCLSTAQVKQQAVSCPKCQVVWVTHDDYDPHEGVITTYRTQEFSCSDCESAVVHFFKTGKFKHSCKSCGGGLQRCSIIQKR